MRVFFRYFERLFVVVLLLSSMGVVDGLTRPPSEHWGLDPEMISTDKAPLATSIIEAGVYVWGAVLILQRRRQVLSAARTVWPLLWFVALGPLSILWSVQPTLTLRRSLLMLGSTAFAIYLGERYSIKKLALLLTQTLCLMMVLVIVVHFVAPSYVIDHRFLYSDRGHLGAWKGLSEHKNVFGGYMAVAIILLILVRFRHLPLLRYIFLLTAAVLLLLSHSSASLLNCVLITATMPLWHITRLSRQRRFLIYPMMTIAFFLAIYVSTRIPDLLFRLLGRDSTFTGRTQVWSLVLHAITKHPILGYGYGAFWDVVKGETLDVWVGAGFLARAADNGYLDLCLAFGVIGVPIFVYLFVRYFLIAIDYFRSEADLLALWPVTYFAFFALHNLSESSLMQSWRSLPFLMFAAIITSLALDRRRRGLTLLHPVPEAPAALPRTGVPQASDVIC